MNLNFGIFKKKKTLGFLTAYGIEYVYNYLGEERVNQKLLELKGKASMGWTFDEFINRKPENCFASSQGSLGLFINILDNYFDNDLQLAIFLYEKSKEFTEENYFTKGILKEKWEEHLAQVDKMIKFSPRNRKSKEYDKINPYWLNYHWFYTRLIIIIIKTIRQQGVLKLDLVGAYDLKKNKLFGKVNLEVKKRKLPFTQKYLSIKDLGYKTKSWYYLEEIYIIETEEMYSFKKSNGEFNLIINLKENKAIIELEKNNNINTDEEDFILGFDFDNLMEEIIKNYLSNLEKVTKAMLLFNLSISFKQREVNRLLNSFIEYYEVKNDEKGVERIKKEVDRYNDIWEKLSFTLCPIWDNY